MKHWVAIFCFSIFSSSFAQNYKAKYILYQTGRPQSFEMNNAADGIGKNYKVRYNYVSGSGVLHHGWQATQPCERAGEHARRDGWTCERTACERVRAREGAWTPVR